MRKIFKLFTLIILLAMFVLPSVYAEVPHLINYQGRLTDANGVSLNNAYKITFRIYDAENAGTLLWQGTYNNVSITKGIFSILLGDTNDTGYNFQILAFDKPYWLEIKVGEDAPMKPRQRITSVGYAIKAEKADFLTTPADQGDILYYNGSAWTKLPAGSPGQFLQTQGVGSSPQWVAPAFSNMQVFTSSGTWIKPAGITKVLVKVIGGGGGSSGNYSGQYSASGGGSGGYAEKICTVTGNVTVTVGVGGTGSTNASIIPGGNGGDSSFGTFCTAGGGQGGQMTAAPGTGGTATEGDLNATGFTGNKGTGKMDIPNTQSMLGISYGYGGGPNGTNGGAGLVVVYW
ncbi:MAG: hypothetical protein Q7K98_05610 [Candidatus Omnitrophota bacterium]|nr:hypothetical protein [Candidatus Omnitrophota bacterium]